MRKYLIGTPYLSLFGFGFLGNLRGFATSLEFLHASSCVYDPLFTSEEGVTGATDFDRDGLFSRARGKGITASTGNNGRLVIFRVNGCFHKSHQFSLFLRGLQYLKLLW